MSNINMRVYIAAPFFKPDQLDVVKNVELELDVAKIAYHSPRTAGVLKEMTPEGRMANSSRIFQSNIDELNYCTHCVAVLDGYDAGTMFEVGYLYATYKRIVTYSPHKYTLNVMLSEAVMNHVLRAQDIVPALNNQLDYLKTDDVI